jgi:hypothetical protein
MSSEIIIYLWINDDFFMTSHLPYATAEKTINYSLGISLHLLQEEVQLRHHKI